MSSRPLSTPEREAFAAEIGGRNLAPLWDVLADLVTPEPGSACRPALWPWAETRPDAMRAGELITAEEAIRRVLVLENPGMPGQSCITTSLYAGLQLILPGEVAPAHRHTQSALRFVIEGEGAYTAVGGEKTMMCEGDFVSKYANPETGDFAMPTIATFMQLLPQGFATASYRSTDASVFTVVEGRGTSRVGEEVFAWGPHDVFVVPSWHSVRHEADDDAVLFSFSDRAIQAKLGLWREDRGNN
jgi:gentisate 1,2-dioxygenase